MGGQEGPVRLATDGWVLPRFKKQIPDSSRFLTVRWGLSVVYEMVQKYTAGYLGV